MGGVVWNRVTFHWPSWVVVDDNRSARGVFSPNNVFTVYTSSEIAGILLRLTVSARDIMVTEKVALSKGSSQQGNARRAAVGFSKRPSESRIGIVITADVPRIESKRNISSFLRVPKMICSNQPYLL